MFSHLEWPGDSEFRRSTSLRSQVNELAGDARSLLVEFRETDEGELLKGLEATACQFVCCAAVFACHLYIFR